MILRNSPKGEGHPTYVSLRASNIPRMIVNVTGHNIIQLAGQGKGMTIRRGSKIM